ncbi:MAG: hypothetical protein H8D45_32395 [Bacteroidetes bacterium]|nr:hypothetical protein [Bacteroidota bacterium]
MTSAHNFGHPYIERIRKETEELKLHLREMDYGSDLSQSHQNKLFPVFPEVPELGIQLVRLQREVEIQNTLFTFLTQQYEEAKIQEARDTPTVQLLDKAVLPIKRSSPKRTIIVIVSGLGSVFLSVVFVFFLENWKHIYARMLEKPAQT